MHLLISLLIILSVIYFFLDQIITAKGNKSVVLDILVQKYKADMKCTYVCMLISLLLGKQ